MSNEEEEPDVSPEPAPNPTKPARPPEEKPAEPQRNEMMERLIRARTILLSGQVDDKLSTRVVMELLVLEAESTTEPITIFLNSPGGSVTAGFAIYDVMRFISAPIRILCNGLTASIATIILLGAKKDQRFALPNARLLIHQPLIPMAVYGPASDLEITAQEILKTRARINELLAKETGQTLAKIEADTQRDYWLTASEAVAYGLVTKVVNSRDEMA